jgi:vaccinia related kinase
MPVHRGSGSHTFKGEKYRFLVMDRFGTDLQKLLVESGNKFSERNAFNLAIRIVSLPK